MSEYKIILIAVLLIGLLLIINPVAPRAQSLYVEGSEVKSYLKLAEDYEKLGRWHEAIEQYQAAIKKYPYGVCQIKPDRPGSPAGRYVSIKSYYLEKLRQYPSEGLQAYRVLFNTTSEALFTYAIKERDETVLKRIIDEMFFTEYGDDAAYFLAEILAERKEFGTALKYWQDIVNLYPDTNLSVPLILTQMALTAKALGEQTIYESVRTRLSTMPPDTKVYWGSDELFVDDIIKRLDKCTFDNGSADPQSDKLWTTLGGNNAHNLSMKSESTNENKKWSYDLIGVEVNVQRPLLSRFAISPCIANEIIYINNGINIQALGLKTGKLLRAYPPDWEKTRGHYKNLITSSTLGQSQFVFGCALSASGGNEMLYANFLDSTKRTNIPGMAGYSAYLAAIEPRTFKERWNTKNITDELFSQMNLLSPPLSYADKVYAAGVKATGVETQVYLWCFNRHTGNLLWRRFICARPSSFPGTQGYQIVSTPILAESEGVVVCLTNQGAVAAFDATTGEISWMFDYLIDETDQRRLPQTSEWIYSYPVIKGNILACLPLHATKIYGFNLYNGKLIWQKQVAHGDTLIGLSNDILFIQGNDISGVNIITGKTLWSQETMLFKNISVCGRGCVSPKYIYLPCANGLLRIDRVTLKVVDNPPLGWLDPRDVPNDLLILDKQLINLSPFRISIFNPFERK